MDPKPAYPTASSAPFLEELYLHHHHGDGLAASWLNHEPVGRHPINLRAPSLTQLYTLMFNITYLSYSSQTINQKTPDFA